MKSLRWRSVSGGIIALAMIVAATLFTLKYARSGALHGKRFLLFVVAQSANNLRVGSEVWLNGQRVGLVREITFNAPSSPIDSRVVIRLDVLTDVQRRIRVDSRANLQSGGTIIGEPVVYIEAGSRGAARVVAGDTLHANTSADLEFEASRVTKSLDQLPPILANGHAIIADAKTTTARLSEIMSRGIGNHSISNGFHSLASRGVEGRRHVARMLDDTTLRATASRAMAGVDSLRRMLATQADAMGRFRRDTSLAPTVRALRDDVDRLRTQVTSTDGTIGRVASDSALRRGLDSASVELRALFADIKAHPTRYLHVF